MDEETQKIIQEKFLHLPKAIQQTILSADLTNKLQNVGRKNNLRIDQLGSLYTEVYLVLIGLAHPSEFVSNVKNSLGISNENAREVAVSINTEIFLPLREEIRKIYEEKQEKPAEPAQPSAFYNPPPVPSPKPSMVSPSPVKNKDNKEESVHSFLSAQTGRELPPPPKQNSPSYIKDWEEENLNREDILKEIENPSLIGQKANKTISNSPNYPRPTEQRQPFGQVIPNKIPDNQIPKEENIPKQTAPEPPINLPIEPAEQEFPVKSFAIPTAPIASTRTMERDIENMAVGLKNDKPAFPPEPKPPTFSPTTPARKPSPSPPQAGGEEDEVLPENLIARKLSQPAGAPREKSEYAMDPYREPVE